MNIKVDVFKEFFVMLKGALILSLGDKQLNSIHICRLLGVYTANH